MAASGSVPHNRDTLVLSPRDFADLAGELITIKPVVVSANGTLTVADPASAAEFVVRTVYGSSLETGPAPPSMKIWIVRQQLLLDRPLGESDPARMAALNRRHHATTDHLIVERILERTIAVVEDILADEFANAPQYQEFRDSFYYSLDPIAETQYINQAVKAGYDPVAELVRLVDRTFGPGTPATRSLPTGAPWFFIPGLDGTIIIHDDIKRPTGDQ